MEIVNKGNVKFLVSDKLKGVIHGFSLREGGVSEGEFGSLNVGLRRGDNPFNAIKNIEICCDSLLLKKENLTLTHQTHTSNVKFISKDDIGKGFIKEWGEGVDGIVTDMANVPLMCYSADCVPVIMYDPVGKKIGAVHSGWRGTAENISKNAIEVMCENGSRREDVRCFIGPAIGMCCYEVSSDVAERFLMYPDYTEKRANGKYHIDLKGIVKRQLISSGVWEENIELCSYCTACNNDMFFSHRRQMGKSGLLGGFIQI